MEIGTVFAVIRGNDSGNTSYGVEVAGERWFVKAAPDAQRWQLEAAVRVHAVLRHPSVVPLLAHFEVVAGLAAVYPWVDGENVRDAPGALERFRALPDELALAAYDTLLDVHRSVVDAGLVAVDLYTGSLMYDVTSTTLRLIDLDLFSPPYRLELERQYGSSSLMPPEEMTRGAWVDERATVFTLARLADHLGCARSAHHRSAIAHATRPRPGDRFSSVAAFEQAWKACE